jgi:hypothetical protein
MTRGPKAPIGKYQVRLRADGKSFTQPFEIKMDPNLKGVTEADIKATFEMASRIRDKETEANEAVILIRDIKSKLYLKILLRLKKSCIRQKTEAARTRSTSPSNSIIG